MALTDFVTGYQHVGIPTQDMEATKQFYEALGFQSIYETTNNGGLVRFFSCGDILIETYEKEGCAQARGAIDHIALAVNDIEAVTRQAQEQQLSIAEGPTTLPFWENGVRYICIEGPNHEIVEFLQKY